MKKSQIVFLVILSLLLGTVVANKSAGSQLTDDALVARFEQLSRNGNSSCSGDFYSSISSMPDNQRIKGSCCSPMSFHRYSEQVKGLQKFKNISEIPQDPYDIAAKQAKDLLSHYDDKLTIEEQEVYNYAMKNSHEKGPCCCKCWRWYVYGGLGKVLIQKHNFTGEQLVKVWNLSDGCGGEADHVDHS